MPGDNVRELRCRLLLEETLEFIRASGFRVVDYDGWQACGLHVQAVEHGKPNLVAMAHETADVLYVAFGNAIAMGVDMGPVFDLIHVANMAKFGPDGRPIRRADGKTLKPEGWRPADVSAALAAQKVSP